MSIVPRVIFPEMLLLLPLVVIAVYLGSRIRTLSAFRKWTATTLRAIILLCLIFALAGMEIVRQSEKLAVFFLVDKSHSVPETIQLAAIESIRSITALYMDTNDEAGLIIFGEWPSIETSVGASLEIDGIRSYVGREQSDLASAVRVAMAAYPHGTMRRMVIYSDGNETRGSAVEEAKLARAAGVEVSVVPLFVEGGNEVRIREVATPSRVDAGEPFQVQVVIHSDNETEGTLRLAQRVRGQTRLLPEQRVRLNKGDTTLILTQELPGAGFYEYEAYIDAPGDIIMANNEGRAFTVVHGEPSVLLVEASLENSPHLMTALEAEGVVIDRVSTAGLPPSLAQLQNYNAIVLSDVSATDLSTEQMFSLEAMVRDMGTGLVMVGGPNSFGAGGFHETPIERALPVNMDLKQRKVLPRGALMLVIDKSGSMSGLPLEMAKRAAIAAVEVLSSEDYVGVIAFDGTPYSVVPLQLAADKRGIINRIGTIGEGGGTVMYPAIEHAHAALSGTSASVKHCVVLTDGQSTPGDFEGVVKRMAADAITVSTVALGHGADRQLLTNMAGWGEGRYYSVDSPSDIPQIFTKEAAIIRRKMLIEEPFTPLLKHESELLLGIAGRALPLLAGYVVTTPKGDATIALTSHEDDPVLAHWRYGLGKSVAFTSDATSRWAADWLHWEGFNSFWAQNVRWAMRETAPSDFRVDTFVRDGKGHVRIDAVDSAGNFVNFLRPSAVVTGPAPDFERMELDFVQTGPGIYEASFHAEQQGVNMVNVIFETPDGGRGMIPTGLAVNYSREYEYNTTNRALLEQIAHVGGGRVMAPLDNPFVHDLPSAPSVTPAWPWLLALAVCLLPVEIFIRRVIIDLVPVYEAAARAVRALPGLKHWVSAPAPRQVPVTGGFGLREARAFAFRGGTDARTDAGADVPLRTGSMDQMVKPVSDAHAAAPLATSGAGASDYTRQLLAAKERALDRKRRRASAPNKEDE